ncbi:DUF202 domain-containing protein [Arthrobacter sp. NPDC057388]|uniref:DUF202 domain-containing protein n=1 Tax=Arthrobacter sp. NPDC057388 TaxID=3346116 RepID=UPI003634FB27
MPTKRSVTSHCDPGLQPERTDLAWGRTALALVVSAAIFLRWLPHHGWFVSVLIAAATISAWTTHLTRKRRFRRAVQGINRGQVPPDTASAATLAASVIVLALLGIYAVMFLPPMQ